MCNLSFLTFRLSLLPPHSRFIGVITQNIINSHHNYYLYILQSNIWRHITQHTMWQNMRKILLLILKQTVKWVQRHYEVITLNNKVILPQQYLVQFIQRIKYQIQLTINSLADIWDLSLSTETCLLLSHEVMWCLHYTGHNKVVCSYTEYCDVKVQ